MSKNPPTPGARDPDNAGDLANLSFEDALEQVEAIIERIEQGQIGLEQSLAEYERGVRLVAHCRLIHKHTVQRVEDLTQRLLANGGSGGIGGPGNGGRAPDMPTHEGGGPLEG